MLRNYSLQSNTYNMGRYNTISPNRYLYFDNFFQKMSEQKRPLSLTINLFDGKVSVHISTEERSINIKGDKDLKYEVMRHISQLSISRKFSIEVI